MYNVPLYLYVEHYHVVIHMQRKIDLGYIYIARESICEYSIPKFRNNNTINISYHHSWFDIRSN